MLCEFSTIYNPLIWPRILWKLLSLNAYYICFIYAWLNAFVKIRNVEVNQNVYSSSQLSLIRYPESNMGICNTNMGICIVLLHAGRTEAKAFAKNLFYWSRTKLKVRRRSDTAQILNINDARSYWSSFNNSADTFWIPRRLGSGEV